MEALKEYAGVVTALVTVVVALGALGLWAINAQVTPEINRLEGRIDGNQLLLRQIDRKIDAKFEGLDTKFEGLNTKFEGLNTRLNARFEAIDRRFEAIDRRFVAIDLRFEAIDRRFETVDAGFERIDGELKTIRNDIKTILLRLPDKAAAQ